MTLITGRQIKDDTITSEDIQDGTIQMEDLSDHTRNMVGVFSGWRDMTSDIKVRGSGGASPTWAQMSPSPFWAYNFTVGKECWSNFHINHDYKPGGQVFIHIHWTSNGTSKNVVRWRFQYAVAKGHNQSVGGTFPFASAPYVTGSVDVNTPGSGTAWRHMVSEMPSSIILDNVEPDSIIMVRLSRVANGATENPNTIFALTMDCHYEADRVITKNKAPNFYE